MLLFSSSIVATTNVHLNDDDRLISIDYTFCNTIHPICMCVRSTPCPFHADTHALQSFSSHLFIDERQFEFQGATNCKRSCSEKRIYLLCKIVSLSFGCPINLFSRQKKREFVRIHWCSAFIQMKTKF